MKEESKTQTEIVRKEAREGTIWILRDDLNKSMDFYEGKRQISQKQYKRIKDEFEYYRSIGGNHDVQDRWDMFYAKIISGDIKMTTDNSNVERVSE